MESADRAMSSAERLVVPLNTICSRKWVMPFSDSRSFREPVRSHTPSDTDRTAGMVSVTIVRPFDRTCLFTLSISRNHELRLSHLPQEVGLGPPAPAFRACP